MSHLKTVFITAALSAGAVSSAHAAAVATVDGRDISAAVFDMYVFNATEALGLDSSRDGQELTTLESGILAELIDRSLIESEAERRGLVPAPEKLKAHQAHWRNSLGGTKAYRAYLASHGLEDAELRASLAQELYGELLLEELTKGLHISDAAVADFYRRHRNVAQWLRIPARVRASHILVAARRSAILRDLTKPGLTEVALQNAVVSELGRREDFAKRLRKRAQAGGDFAALARRHSDDPGSRAAGGDLGWFTSGTHTPAFDDAVFELVPDEIGSVVQTDYGFHIVRLIARQPERSMTLREAAPEIRRRLLAKRRAEVLNEWLSAAREFADIEIFADIDYSPVGRPMERRSE
ncbi:MAG: peptidylprolyl isomerase [Gammaproteobacteria bacterium]